MTKQKKDISISFIDEQASEQVTGSGVYIQTPHHNILLDYGLCQTNDKYEDLLVNKKRPKEFKYKDIDLAFISHNHIDHLGRLPMLYRNGSEALTVVAKQNYDVMKTMLMDCAYINQRDIELINIQRKTKYEPLYTEEDVVETMSHVKEFEYGSITVIDDEISFELIPSGHLLGSAQIMLYITVNGVTKSICYSGDLGNRKVQNRFVGEFKAINKCNIFIGESTYGDRPTQKISVKKRRDDLNKFKTIIDNQVKEAKGRVIIPTFAQSRCQQLALMIYNLYKFEDWQPKVYIDSPLSIAVFKQYAQILDGEDKQMFDELLQWDKLIFTHEPSESMALVDSEEPCVILSSSGFCQVGRIRKHLKKQVVNPNATVLFCGYASPNSLSGILRDPKTKEITIDEKKYKVRCACFNLKSMSGHMPYDQLLDYYSSIDCDKVILHHGSKEAKEYLAKELKKAYENKCKTTRVICANSSLKFSL